MTESLGDPLTGQQPVWFLAELLLTFGASAAVALAVIRAWCGPGTLRRERVLIALGAGPAAIPLLLNVLLLVLPRQSSGFYVVVVMTVLAGAAWCSRRHLAPALREARASFRWLAGWHAARRSGAILPKLWSGLLAAILAYASVCAVWTIVSLPTVGHDTWEYGTIARTIFRERAIEFRRYPFFQQSGFYSVSRHAPSFPLFHTWERLLDDAGGAAVPTRASQPAPKDSLFRWVSLHYGLLILATTAHIAARHDRSVAALAPIALFYSPAFYLAVYAYYVDPFRIFFLLMSLVALHRVAARPTAGGQALLGVLIGFAAYAHSIGAVSALPILGAFVIAAPLSLGARVAAAIRLGVYALLAGGLHYVLDVAIGTGWIFKR